MTTERTHRVLVAVDVVAVDDEDQIMAQVGRMFAHPLPLGARVAAMHHVGALEVVQIVSKPDDAR